MTGQRDVLAAALAMTCPDPQDRPEVGECGASQHIEQANKVIKLLDQQGYRVVHISELGPS